MTVQDIVDAVSIDTRQVLQPSGNDATIIIGWVDRVQKDMLHSSLYINQNLATTPVTTTVGASSYTMNPPSSIRRIVGVYDSTFNHSLMPMDVDVDQPTPVQSRTNEEQGRPISASVVPAPHQAYKFGGTPEYFRFLAPVTLVLRPAPPSVAYLSTLVVTYEKLVPTLFNLSDQLTIPDDGKDVICAGVNWMAMTYIGRSQEAMSWFQLYQQLKAGSRVGVIR